MSSYVLIAYEDKKDSINNIEKCDTLRHIEITENVINDCLRLTYGDYSVINDTSRRVHNYNNIIFDTYRGVNNKRSILVDTKRRIISENMVDCYSVFLKVGNKTVEVLIFPYTDIFPFPDKYLTVNTHGIKGYVPLVPVGYDDTDSGGRYTDENGEVYQICSFINNNVLNTFTTDNYIINANSIINVYNGFRSIFSGNQLKLDLDNECIYLHIPSYMCGITKMFLIGLYVSVSIYDEGEKETANTYYNGLCKTSYGGDNHNKANALLIKFKQHCVYKITCKTEYKNVKYEEEDLVTNAIIIGKDVEELNEESDSYVSLVDTESYSIFDHGIVKADDVKYPQYKDVNYLKAQWMCYPHSTKQYNFIDFSK